MRVVWLKFETAFRLIFVSSEESEVSCKINVIIEDSSISIHSNIRSFPCFKF